MNRTIKIISLVVITATLLASAMAQGQRQNNAAPKPQSQTSAGAQSANTPGRIAKFTGTKTLGDANITEDDSGNIGIGTTLPTSLLTVNGIIEMMSAQGGIKFPDGTRQTTAGLPVVSRDGTLKGNGTQASPLGVAFPLIIVGPRPDDSALIVGNSGDNGIGITALGGHDGGAAVWAEGADNINNTTFAGVGIRVFGGRNDVGSGALGVSAVGGQGIGGQGGLGVEARGGLGSHANGGGGAIVFGGTGLDAGKRGGHGIEAFPGFGGNGATNGLAGKFNGDVQVTGVLSKAGGSFKIDHPLDPENKYLSHSFVESPDMKNIYDGIVSLDTNGQASIEMPEWFDALNRDFRYLLTAVGAPMPGLYIAEEIANNRFKIAGGLAGMKVSWQVTGVRQDAWANKNRIQVEEVKSEKERGHYLHPEAFGQAEERGVEWASQPELMRQIKQRRLETDQARQRQ